MTDIDKHFQAIRRVLWIVLVLNWMVAAAKIVYGMMSRSSSMTADGFHSLSDGMSNIIGIVGIYFCSQPKDDDHPYGHKKYETLFAMGIAGMLLFVSFNLAKQGIGRIANPVTPQVDMASFLVMLITLAVNAIVMTYEYRRGKQLQSDILIVDSMHTRADIFTSISVIVALIGVKIGFPIVDPIITLVISCFIAYAAYEIIRQESRILCDAIAITDTSKIKDVVCGMPGVKSCHKIRSRGRADDVHLDLHVQVDPNMIMRDSHRLSYALEEKIIKSFPGVTDVLVHLEPYTGKENG
jgi:cation diffusion facilitator family transporter